MKTTASRLSVFGDRVSFVFFDFSRNFDFFSLSLFLIDRCSAFSASFFCSSNLFKSTLNVFKYLPAFRSFQYFALALYW